MISESYRELNRQLHSNPAYGAGGEDVVEDLATFIGQRKITSVLDYGAGKQRLTHLLRDLTDARVDAYDPSVEEIQHIPLDRYDFVICKDVMEHIEPDWLSRVLEHQAGLTRRFCWQAISRIPAKKTLPDGRNAHLIIESHAWWKKRVSQYFRIYQQEEHSVYSLFWLGPKPQT